MESSGEKRLEGRGEGEVEKLREKSMEWGGRWVEG